MVFWAPKNSRNLYSLRVMQTPCSCSDLRQSTQCPVQKAINIIYNTNETFKQIKSIDIIFELTGCCLIFHHFYRPSASKSLEIKKKKKKRHTIIHLFCHCVVNGYNPSFPIPLSIVSFIFQITYQSKWQSNSFLW